MLGYKDELGNPPLLVVSDLERIEIHTNFTGLSPIVKLVTLDDLAADDPSDALQVLRDVFTAPEELRPRIQPAQITEQAARHVAEIAQSAGIGTHRSWRSPSTLPSGSVTVATRRPPPTSCAGSFTVAPAAVTSASFASISGTCQ